MWVSVHCSFMSWWGSYHCWPSRSVQPPCWKSALMTSRWSSTTSKMCSNLSKSYRLCLAKSNRSFLMWKRETINTWCLVQYDFTSCDHNPVQVFSWAQQNVQTYNRYIHIDLLGEEPPNWLNLCVFLQVLPLSSEYAFRHTCTWSGSQQECSWICIGPD